MVSAILKKQIYCLEEEFLRLLTPFEKLQSLLCSWCHQIEVQGRQSKTMYLKQFQHIKTTFFADIHELLTQSLAQTINKLCQQAIHTTQFLQQFTKQSFTEARFFAQLISSNPQCLPQQMQQQQSQILIHELSAVSELLHSVNSTFKQSTQNLLTSFNQTLGMEPRNLNNSEKPKRVLSLSLGVYELSIKPIMRDITNEIKNSSEYQICGCSQGQSVRGQPEKVQQVISPPVSLVSNIFASYGNNQKACLFPPLPSSEPIQMQPVSDATNQKHFKYLSPENRATKLKKKINQQSSQSSQQQHSQDKLTTPSSEFEREQCQMFPPQASQQQYSGSFSDRIQPEEAPQYRQIFQRIAKHHCLFEDVNASDGEEAEGQGQEDQTQHQFQSPNFHFTLTRDIINNCNNNNNNSTQQIDNFPNPLIISKNLYNNELLLDVDNDITIESRVTLQDQRSHGIITARKLNDAMKLCYSGRDPLGESRQMDEAEMSQILCNSSQLTCLSRASSQSTAREQKITKESREKLFENQLEKLFK